MTTSCECVLNSRKTRPILRAISPLMPVSISSKIKHGRLRRLARAALSASITRDISPPEATLVSGRAGEPGLAVKVNVARSRPEGPQSSMRCRSTSSTARSKPSASSMLRKSATTVGTAPARLVLRASARDNRDSSASASAVASASSWPSLWAVCPKALRSSSRLSTKACTESTKCFCCKEIKAFRCSRAVSSDSGSLSVCWASSSAVAARSLTSITTDLSRSANSESSGLTSAMRSAACCAPANCASAAESMPCKCPYTAERACRISSARSMRATSVSRASRSNSSKGRASNSRS